jgi:hypothetical protein
MATNFADILPTHYIKVTNAVSSATFDQFTGCTYSKTVNDTGNITFTLNGDDPRLSVFTLDALIEVHRTVPGAGVADYVDWQGLAINPLRKTDNTGARTFNVYGVHLNDLMARRVIAWQKGSPQAAKGAQADVVLRQFVSENCGGEARAALGRVRDGVMPGFSVQTNPNYPGEFGLSPYPFWYGDRSLELLLDVVKEISAFAGLQFNISSDGFGQFYFYLTELLGLDRSYTDVDSVTGRNGAGNVPVTFGVDYGNVSEIEHEVDRAGEKNAIFATGKIGDVDETVFVEGQSVLDSPWNDRESVTTGGARTDVTFDDLIAQASETLALNQKKETIRFTPRQTASCVYGRDFGHGDIVTTVYQPFTLRQIIWSTKVKINLDNSEDIELELFNA